MIPGSNDSWINDRDLPIGDWGLTLYATVVNGAGETTGIGLPCPATTTP